MLNKKGAGEFLPDVLEITEKPVSVAGRFVTRIIFLIIVSAVIWSYVSKIDIIATTTGKIIPDGDVKVVQPLIESSVKQIYASVGDFVNEGDLLIEFNASVKNIDIEFARERLDLERFRKEAVLTALRGEDFSSLEAATEERRQIAEFYRLKADAWRDYKNLYNSQINEYYSVIETAKTSIEQKKQNIIMTDERIDALNCEKEALSVEEKALEIIEIKLNRLRDYENKCLTLLNQGTVSKEEYLAAKNQLDLTRTEFDSQFILIEKNKLAFEKQARELEYTKKNLLGDIEVQNSQIAEYVSSADRIKNAARVYESEEKEKLQSEIVEIDEVINQYAGTISKCEAEIEFSSLKSPSSGIISSVGVNTLGAVVKPADVLFTIIPKDNELIARTALLNKDAGFVKAGREVSLKIEAYPFQEFGVIKGKVKSVSPHSFADEKLGFVYQIDIQMEKDRFVKDGAEYFISSGMQARAEIKTGERRVIEFFLEPLVKYLDESIKLR
jgi:multidrug efflux pump subunit AcrA (membrane-fusion protein)